MKSLAIALLLVLACRGAVADTLNGRVVGVSDGDTVTVLDGDRKLHKIQLGGIDAPEKAQPFGQRSKENLSRMVFGKDVRVEWNKRDKYKRIVGKPLKYRSTRPLGRTEPLSPLDMVPV